jgi:hypothetical protein
MQSRKDQGIVQDSLEMQSRRTRIIVQDLENADQETRRIVNAQTCRPLDMQTHLKNTVRGEGR